MRPLHKATVALLLGLVPAMVSHAYGIDNWWNDGDNIVMDDILSPAGTWSNPAQSQMSEWNYVDTTDKSHPFRISEDPQFSFGSDDGDNTIGFLLEPFLSLEYGLSYASALAWTVCYSGGSRIDECDVMLDPTLPWNLSPDDTNWFQSTVLHELGHVRGLDHYNSHLSMQNSGTSKFLRNETLYMDDRNAIRQHAWTVPEFDLVMYNKFHNGSSPQWMTMSPTNPRVGQDVQLSNITVENRGSFAFGNVTMGVFLSDNSTISTGDQLLETAGFAGFGTSTFSTFNWTVTIPSMNDCATRWLGGIVDHEGVWTERYEGNNAVAFTNGVPYTGTSYTPTPLTIRLAEDTYEPNDSRAAAPTVSLPFVKTGLTIDDDLENDYYKVVVGSSGTLTVFVTFSDAAGDLDLALQNSAGTVLTSSTSIDDNESLSYSLTPGTYYLRVYGYGAGSCNKYSITASFG